MEIAPLAERLKKYSRPGANEKIRHQTAADDGPQQYSPDQKAFFQEHVYPLLWFNRS